MENWSNILRNAGIYEKLMMFAIFYDESVLAVNEFLKII